ncbi:MAG: sigma-54-dependent Fis family transcriptional regulator, partial [Myxococcales bacterium]|nr:sigma-54-dependent Fis family transcriptional regulator [Myxococcales bacterium]
MDEDSTLSADTPATTTAEPDAQSQIGLTLLWHPDVRRVGDRIGFAADMTALSRRSPDFYDRAGQPTGPLADQHVSRTPLVFVCHAHAIEVSGRAVVDGVRLNGSITLDKARLVEGVVIEIAQRIVALLHHVPRRPAGGPTHGLVGDSHAIRRLRRALTQAALATVPVLLHGETGSGKAAAAQAIHAASARSDGPFRAVNVAAVPVESAKAAFFGHARGAFAGAEVAHPGYFGESHHGTLFLDDIDRLPAALQPMVLQAIEAGEVQAVGDHRARPADVRVIAAAGDGLARAVSAGAFSPALLYRLASLEVRVPPLRARRDDIPRLLLLGLERELSRLGAIDRLRPPEPRPQMWLGASLVALLCRHDWPGNVRELLNIARQIALAGFARDEVSADDVPALGRLGPAAILTELLQGEPPRRAVRTSPPLVGPVEVTDVDPTDADPVLTEHSVLDALRRCDWSIVSAAAELGVAKSTLYRFVTETRIVRKARE